MPNEKSYLTSAVLINKKNRKKRWIGVWVGLGNVEHSLIYFGKRLLIVTVISSLLLSCSVVDGVGVGERADGMNRSISDYRNVSTLLNIIRASEFEPLQFYSVAQVTGHNTISSTFALTRLLPGNIGGISTTTLSPTEQ
jgi:hypothetical protein